MTVDELLVKLRERLADAEQDADSSHATAMNSYGAGFDAGVVAVLTAIITDMDGSQ